ncbi:uncharacterized protein [Amphiura filiformis]|uniref:uncharacterized protein n=1 Tax=Amphiura filiformis TaxID=82378 RepID=UPI003B21E288
MLCILWKDRDYNSDVHGQGPLTKGVTSLYKDVIEFMLVKYGLDDSDAIDNQTVLKEFCSATYLADTDHDQFLSAITPVFDNKSLLQFCCGLSLTAASTILQRIVSTTAVNIEHADACIFSVGPRVANPWKLPLLLLFEAESQMSEHSVDTIPQLHAFVSPLVKSIRMNHANWPADYEMCHLLQYFISKKDDKSWLSQVKFAVINCRTEIDIGPSLAREQTKLVESLSNLSTLKLSSSIPQSGVSCTHILRNLRLVTVESESNIQQRQRTEVILSGVNVPELDFLTFLSKQVVPLSVKLNRVTLLEEKKSKSHITINSLNELIVSDSACKGQSLGTVLSRMLSRAQAPLELSLKWTPITETYTNMPVGFELDERFVRDYACVPRARRMSQHAEGRTASKKRRDQRLEIQLQALQFDCFSSIPLKESILTNILLSGCALNLLALTKMLKSQHCLSEITLQSVYLSGNVTKKCVNKTVKKYILKNVTFFDNLATFLKQFPEITDYHLSDVDIQDEIVEEIVTLKSLHNVTISQCKLGSNVNVILRGPVTKLQHLNLGMNSIDGHGASSLAQSFLHTPALQHLNLHANSIGSEGASSLAQEFQHIPALQHLNLASNTAGSRGAIALAYGFQHTPALQYIDLSANSIGSNATSTLAESFQNTPALQHLNLSANNIGSYATSTLAQSFKHTPALQHLNLARNSADSRGASALAQGFQHTPALQHLNLSANSIGSVGASTLATSFQHTPALQYLDLAYNKIGPDGASSLAQSFQHTPALQHLNLCATDIGSDGVSTLAKSLQHAHALQYLDLANNAIGPDGASALAQSFQYTPALQHLNLCATGIGSDGASTLAKSFQHTHALQYLDLANNTLGLDGISTLAQSFEHTPELEHLNLARNSIGSDGALALAPSFQHIPSLRHLNLHANSIGPDGASALAQSFHHLPALRHLNLSDNRIGPDGASALCQSFQHTPALQHLDLYGRHNIIGPDGASALAKSFQLIPALQHLNLGINSIGSDGASALAKSLQHTPSLQHLNLQANNIASDGASALAKSIQHHTALQHIDLRDNSFDSDRLSALL